MDLEKITISSGSTILQTMKVVNDNGFGICFVTNNKKLIGMVTDGDIRRALLKGHLIDNIVDTVMNHKYISLPVTSKDSLIRSKFSSKIKIIPLCDEMGNLVDVADIFKSHRIPVLEPSLSGREMEYVQDCIHSNWISSQGSYVTHFEKVFSDMHHNNEAIAVSNGTSALHLALLSLGIGPKDEVIVPNVTFAASVNAVIYCNATPVLCEIDNKTWCIDCNEIEKLISDSTKAIMPVHLYGQVCEMDKIKKIAQKYNLKIIEDCAEAIGSTYKDKPVGVFGDASTFSFFGNKTVSTGEGGMVIFPDVEIAKKARILRDHGMEPSKRYWHNNVGYNFRLTNIQAAIGVAQMERLDEIVNRKMTIANAYDKKLSKIDGISQLPFHQKYIRHSNWLYTILLDKKYNRDLISKKLMENGIDTRPVFYPLNEMPPYKSYRHSDNLINSRNLSYFGLSLPSSATLKDEDIDFITNNLISALK